MAPTNNNPLLKPSPLKHYAPPFDQIRPEHFLPALNHHIAKAKEQLQKIKVSEPSFENTILGLERMNEMVNVTASTFYNLLSANTNEQLQELSKEIGPLLSEFHNDILLDEELFQKVEAVYKGDLSSLNKEQKKLVEETYQDFTRNGALLNKEQKNKLRKIDEELSKLNPQFADHVLKATHAFQLKIKDQNQLKGLPEHTLETAAQKAKENNFEGWILTLDAPVYTAVMKFAQNRELREKIFKAYSKRAYQDQYDNQDLIKRTLHLRHERATLLGYKNHADFVLQKRMASSPEKALQFVKELIQKSKPVVKKEFQEVKEFAQSKDNLENFQPWDFSYYAEKLKKEKFQIDENDLRPYFLLEQVIQGVFDHAYKLYNVQIQKAEGYPVYHPDVSVYEVFDTVPEKRFLGLLYLDLFPRSSKSGGAWCTTYLGQGLFQGKLVRPVVSIVCNFTQPTPTTPSLLSFREVQTIFHEFGHALHDLLSECSYQSLSGTSVYWDFVELPSQIMENWTFQEESLQLYAKHYKTKEVIPSEYISRLKKSEQFLKAYQTLRTASFALLDLSYHITPPQEIEDIKKFEDRIFNETMEDLPRYEDGCFSCGFSHIFAGGYSAGYYSYQWAEVLDADAFEYFLDEGIFNQNVSSKFRQLLSQGGTEHPMVLYKKFRGREPDPNALFKRNGLTS